MIVRHIDWSCGMNTKTTVDSQNYIITLYIVGWVLTTLVCAVVEWLRGAVVKWLEQLGFGKSPEVHEFKAGHPMTGKLSLSTQ